MFKNSLELEFHSDPRITYAYGVFLEVFSELSTADNCNISIDDIVQLGDIGKALYALYSKKYNLTTVDEKKISDKEGVLRHLFEAKNVIANVIAKLKDANDDSSIDYDNRTFLTHYALELVAQNLYQKPLELPKKLSPADMMVTIYKAKSGELCLRFPNKTMRDKFSDEVGRGQIPSQFVKNGDPQFVKNPNRHTPVAYKDSPQCLYLASYQAKNGEFAINVTKKDIRDNLVKALGIKETGTEDWNNGQKERIFADGFFRVYDSNGVLAISQETAIYFPSDNPIFTKPGAFVKIDTTNNKLIYGEIPVVPKDEHKYQQPVEARPCDFD